MTAPSFFYFYFFLGRRSRPIRTGVHVEELRLESVVPLVDGEGVIV